MDTYTLELRQKEAINVNNNGDYESVVQEKILLEEGDSVVMKSVFIDTQASSNQKINVPEDLTLNFEWINYNKFYYKSGTFINAKQPEDPVSGASGFNYQDPTLQTYASMNIKEATSGPYDFILQLDFNTTNPKKFSGSSKPFDLTISYVNLNGDEVFQKVHVPAIPNSIVPYTIPIVIAYERSRGLHYRPSNLSQFGVILDTKIFIAPANHMVCYPEFNSTSIKLDKGAYSPVDLTNAINKQLTKQKSKPAPNALYGNDFLTVEPSGPAASNWMTCIDKGALDNGPALNVFQPKAGSGKPLLVGADQVELSFSDSTQRFLWNQIHLSILDSNGAPCVSLNPDGKVFTRAGGIMFTHLGAEDSNGNYFDFWENLLGFDLSTLIPKQGLNTSTLDFFLPVNGDRFFLAPYFESIVGESSTEGLASIASLVPSSSAAQTAAGGFFSPLTETVLNPTNGKNVAIEAVTSKLQSSEKFGYFLIEVNAKFMGKYVQKDQMKNNIRAIVGRYYEINSYTSGTQGDSLLYTHIGQPMFLESFKCRILDSDQNLASNLGPDNTIFLQVVKNPKNMEIEKVQGGVEPHGTISKTSFSEKDNKK